MFTIESNKKKIGYEYCIFDAIEKAKKLIDVHNFIEIKDGERVVWTLRKPIK